jgi:hypothetical protein
MLIDLLRVGNFISLYVFFTNLQDPTTHKHKKNTVYWVPGDY